MDTRLTGYIIASLGIDFVADELFVMLLLLLLLQQLLEANKEQQYRQA